MCACAAVAVAAATGGHGGHHVRTGSGGESRSFRMFKVVGNAHFAYRIPEARASREGEVGGGAGGGRLHRECRQRCCSVVVYANGGPENIEGQGTLDCGKDDFVHTPGFNHRYSNGTRVLSGVGMNGALLKFRVPFGHLRLGLRSSPSLHITVCTIITSSAMETTMAAAMIDTFTDSLSCCSFAFSFASSILLLPPPSSSRTCHSMCLLLLPLILFQDEAGFMYNSKVVQ